ncbi:hypothetical protein FRC09_003730 [Ceratobasidium sp. 395]|nr:hypothetical protein FRC09_003730 [Ceratobasidium sp. 395]
MPRQSRSRPSARPASSSSAFGSGGQTRQASTAAYPGTAPPPGYAPAQARPQEARQPGFLAQMAATAGSVAVGSTVGHGLSSMLFGGRSEAPPPAEYQQPVQQQQYQQNSGISCDFQAKEFTKCLETGDVNTCGWYLEQLKACQAAARPY